jgi:hypothetical protein
MRRRQAADTMSQCRQATVRQVRLGLIVNRITAGEDSRSAVGLTSRKWDRQLELLLVSLPQHSGRCGKLERSHPPPRA